MISKKPFPAHPQQFRAACECSLVSSHGVSVSATCASMNCTSARGEICIYVYIYVPHLWKGQMRSVMVSRQEAAGVRCAIPHERSADPGAEKRMRPFIYECDLWPATGTTSYSGKKMSGVESEIKRLIREKILWQHWLQKEVQLYVSVWENNPASHLFYYLSEQFPKEIMISSSSFKSQFKN